MSELTALLRKSTNSRNRSSVVSLLRLPTYTTALFALWGSSALVSMHRRRWAATPLCSCCAFVSVAAENRHPRHSRSRCPHCGQGWLLGEHHFQIQYGAHRMLDLGSARCCIHVAGRSTRTRYSHSCYTACRLCGGQYGPVTVRSTSWLAWLRSFRAAMADSLTEATSSFSSDTCLDSSSNLLFRRSSRSAASETRAARLFSTADSILGREPNIFVSDSVKADTRELVLVVAPGMASFRHYSTSNH